jgi:hypothetical protein
MNITALCWEPPENVMSLLLVSSDGLGDLKIGDWYNKFSHQREVISTNTPPVSKYVCVIYIEWENIGTKLSSNEEILCKMPLFFFIFTYYFGRDIHSGVRKRCTV